MTWYAMFTQLMICKSGECIDIVITRNLVIFSWKHSFLNFHKFAKSNRCIKKNYIGLVFSFSGYIGKSKLNRNEDHGTLTGRIGNINCIHCLWFSSVTVKTFDVKVHWAETYLLRTSSKTLDWNSLFKVEFQFTCIYANFLNKIQIDPRH